MNGTLLRLSGAGGELLALGEEYIAVIALGASTQVIGTGLVPFIRNQGVSGAAWATVLGQGVTMLTVLAWLLRKKQFALSIPFSKLGKVAASILKIGIAPFGLTMSPNISLTIINRFSVSYGGEQAVATYACIAYAICIVYPLFSITVFVSKLNVTSAGCCFSVCPVSASSDVFPQAKSVTARSITAFTLKNRLIPPSSLSD